MVAAYLGWIVYGASAILIPSTNAVAAKRGNIVDILAISLLVIFWALFAVQKAKFTLYLYLVFPIYFWRQALNRSIGQLSTLFSGISYVDSIVKGIAVITTLEGMVVCIPDKFILLDL